MSDERWPYGNVWLLEAEALDAVVAACASLRTDDLVHHADRSAVCGHAAIVGGISGITTGLLNGLSGVDTGLTTILSDIVLQPVCVVLEVPGIVLDSALIMVVRVGGHCDGFT